MARINLWELITTVASLDDESLNSDRCKEIKAITGPSFGSELDLDVHNGCWTVRIFCHEDESQYVQMDVHPNGRVRLIRSRVLDDVSEVRSISF